MSAAAIRTTAALTLLIAIGCRSAPPPAPTPHEVRYRLEWTTDGVAAGSELTNDLGYRIHLKRGWITSYSMELVECPKADATASERIGRSGWSWLFDDGIAWAGHNAGTPNPAAIKPMQVESLTDPQGHDVGNVMLAPQPYCQLHYLVARAGHDSPGLPSELDMVDTTIHLDGTYRAPGGGAETPFTVHSASAYGQLFARVVGADRPLHVDTGRESVQIVVRRRLAKIFDGVDFATMKEKALALRILESVVEHVEVEVRPLDAQH